MEPATTYQFARAARALAGEARRAGLAAPSFRCPPRLTGVNRTLRRRGHSVVVAVRVRGRPWVAVLGDLIEGIVVANGLRGAEADRIRARLWEVVAPEVGTVEQQRVA
jgi:hypothetical protein